jgi:hypothetical protein
MSGKTIWREVLRQIFVVAALRNRHADKSAIPFLHIAAAQNGIKIIKSQSFG